MIGRIQGSTLITYPKGAVYNISPVRATLPVTRGTGVVTEETPFHPLDHYWPDQPADSGVMTVDSVDYPATKEL
jgi:alanyl-tRNA synthetase